MLNKKIKISKKGTLAAAQLAIAIIIILGFVVLVPSISYAQKKAEGKSEEITCHNSIAFRSLTTINVAQQDIKVARKLCKTIEKDISDSRDKIKDEIAYKMSRCWWMYNEGRHEKALDDAGKFLSLLGWSETEKPCALCYDFKIDEKNFKTSEEGTAQSVIPADELFRYMEQNEHRQLKGWKYLDYIQYYGGPGELGILANIEPQKHYGIVFLPRTTDTGEFGHWSDTVAGVGVAGGVLAGVACFASIGCGVTLIGAGIVSGLYLGGHAANEINAFFDKDRPLSMVVLANLKDVEARCQADISGE